VSRTRSKSLRCAVAAALALACGANAPSPPDHLYDERTDVRPRSANAESISADAVFESDEGPLRKLVTYSRVYEIDRIFKSMRGPRSTIGVRLREHFEGEPELLWIKGVYSEVVDEAGADTVSQEFMCHLVAGVQSTRHRDRKLGIATTDSRFAMLSPGNYFKEYPVGFGVPVLTSDRIQIISQVLNLNRPDPDLRIRHKVTVLYMRDSERQTPMRAIANTYAQSMVLVNGKPGDGYFGVRIPDEEIHGESCAVGQKASSFFDAMSDPYGREFTPHWLITPGRSVNQTLATQLMDIRHDTTIHTIDVHVHPFAESLELRDLTTQETLFKSHATNVDEGIGVAHVETYRSEEGIPVYADHQYAIISTYNNTTGVEQDAMASLYMGIYDPEFDPKLIGDRAALALRRRDRLRDAVTRSRAGVRADPDDPQAHFRLGVALFRLEQREEAIPHLERAVDLNPNYEKAQRALRVARRKAGS
jgi:hypothetical protein